MAVIALFASRRIPTQQPGSVKTRPSDRAP
jgi:hypothetical protein